MSMESQVNRESCLPFELEDHTFTHQRTRPCSFDATIFEGVMLNLVQNPNILASHLYRADLFYDSLKDLEGQSYLDGARNEPSLLISQIKKDYRPLKTPITFTSPMQSKQRQQIESAERDASGMSSPSDLDSKTQTERKSHITRTIVRQLVPRNPRLDKPLLQTCHFVESAATRAGEQSELSVVYLPHGVTKATDMPFYHPPVRAIAFHWSPVSPTALTAEQDDQAQATKGVFSIHTSNFPPADDEQQDPSTTKRFSSTMQNLLATILKHGTQNAATPGGKYTKRVQHDVIIPRQRYQDSLVRLKLAYATDLLSSWQEVTDPGKHVFEDICIAAFLEELWRDTYGLHPPSERSHGTDEDMHNKAQAGLGSNGGGYKGFIDIGCGNGLLVHVLRREGYAGTGFDARARKSWGVYALPERIDDRNKQETSETRASEPPSLEARVLIPPIYDLPSSIEPPAEDQATTQEQLPKLEESSPTDDELHRAWLRAWKHPTIAHTRVPTGTFIISNHADELTAWTPLLAFLDRCPFVAIPCCSHDLAGRRMRFPARYGGEFHRGPQASSESPSPRDSLADPPESPSTEASKAVKGPASKPLSAYNTLCGYVCALAREVGFEVEREVLRIPSTRNIAIVGRRGRALDVSETDDHAERLRVVTAIVERELGMGVALAGRDWVERAVGLSKKPSRGGSGGHA